ncbi:MAG: efflux RND transporter periplasmic adaptor subunit [Myxococcota bacterium]
MTPRASRVCRGLALAGLLFGCGPEAQESRPVGAPVVLANVELRDLQERIEAPGELVAKNRAQIAAEVDGQITAVLVDEGDSVEPGAEIVLIDPDRQEMRLEDAEARVAEARADVTERERSLRRTRALRRRDVASQAQVDEAATQLATARARLLAAQANLGVARRALADSKLRAPFAGLIARRLVSRGEYVRSGQPLFELVSLDPIEVEFRVVETDSGRVRKGQPVDVRVAPFPDRVFRATVSIISPTLDRRTRTLRVKALLHNPGGTLRPGLFARVDLGIAERHAVTMVPEEAVLQRADGSIVFRALPDDRVERRRVRTGLHRDGWVEIVSGLSGRDRVVRRGQTELIDGSLISARNPDGTPVVAAGPPPGAEIDGADTRTLRAADGEAE